MIIKKPIIIEHQKTNYEITSTGKVFNLKTGKELKGYVLNSGYQMVTLFINKQKKNYQVHRLMAMTFLDNPKKLPVVNHIDGNKSNNNLSNLEWVSYSQNSKHAQDKGLIKQNKNKKRKTKIEQRELEKNWKQYLDSNYYISKYGQVYNTKTNIILCPSITNDGYKRCSLRINNKTINVLVHHLVYVAWNGNKKIPKNKIINHLDGNKTNNDLSNLECVSKRENTLHARRVLLKGVKPVIKYNEIEYYEYPSMVVAAKENDITISAISLAIKNHSMSRTGYYWKLK